MEPRNQFWHPVADRSITLPNTQLTPHKLFQHPASQQLNLQPRNSSAFTSQLPNIHHPHLCHLPTNSCQPPSSNPSSSFPSSHFHKYQISTEGEVWRGGCLRPCKKPRKNLDFWRGPRRALWENTRTGHVRGMWGACRLSMNFTMDHFPRNAFLSRSTKTDMKNEKSFENL